MGDIEKLLMADAQRREAMISGNSSELADLLSDELVWTHSSGKTDDKKAVLESIVTKTVIYQSMQVEDARVSQHGAVFVYQGLLLGKVTKAGAEKDLRNKFLSVWKQRGSSFEMLAWQSTGI